MSGSIGTYIARRLPRLVVTVLLVTLVLSLMLDLLPGDAATQIAAAELNPTPERIAAIRDQLNLDEPVLVRWWTWTTGLLHGDFGTSFRTGQPVLESIVSRLPVTIELMVLAQIFALAFAVVVATVSAARPGRWPDRIATTATLGMLSIPNFILGLVLIVIFAVQLHLLPATGFVPLTQSVGDNLRSMLLPAIALAAPEAAIYTRLLRAEMIGVLEEDFVTTARLKGIRPSRVLFRHALRPSSLALVTVAGLNAAALIGGSVIVENLFALPGIGRLTTDAIRGIDYVTVQGVVAFIALAYVVINLLTDILYLILDPRNRS